MAFNPVVDEDKCEGCEDAWTFALLKYLKWLMGNHPRLMRKNVLAVKAALRFVKLAQSPSKKPDRTPGSLDLNQGPGNFRWSYYGITFE